MCLYYLPTKYEITPLGFGPSDIMRRFCLNWFLVGKDRVEKTNVIVKAMTKTMVEALKIPHFGYKDEVLCDD